MERLRIVFWQNINSMHQSAFLKALAMEHDVTLVTTRKGSGREEMGWYDPELKGVTLLHIRDIDWKRLIRDSAPEDVHVFAGLHAFAFIHRALRYAMNRNVRVGVYAEPLMMKGFAGMVKQWRGRLDALRFSGKLDFILCIGRECRRQYLGWGFPQRKLYDWAYVTEPFEPVYPSGDTTRPFRIIFPASWSQRKGADLLLEAAASIPSDLSFELICHSMPPGPPDAFLRRSMQRIEGMGHIKLHPYIDNAGVRMAIANADLLVLPSRFDGWGAVVNEALGAGTPVLVSDRCGASILIEGRPILGKVMGLPDTCTLKDALMNAIKDGAPSIDRREGIRSWADRHISGTALAAHFMNILDASALVVGKQMTAPWVAGMADPFSGNTSEVH